MNIIIKDKKIIAFVFFEVIFILLILGVVFGKLSFGVGIGDVFYVVVGLLVVSLLGILFFSFPRKRKWILLFMFACLLYYVLVLTVLRGAEFPWDGSLFR